MPQALEPAMQVSPDPRPGRTPRLVAAALAAALTWGLFSIIVSIGAPDREQWMLAAAARQGGHVPQVASAPSPAHASPVVIAAATPTP
jgi:hypothetical protein